MADNCPKEKCKNCAECKAKKVKKHSGTTVKELIKKLSRYDQKLEVIIESAIDCTDVDCYANDMAADAISRTLKPITTYITEVQSHQEYDDDGEKIEDSFEYIFGSYVDAIDTVKVLVISSPALKYGAREDDKE